ncbi:MAG: DUF1957 domain-containing protein [Candidatus Omnitrophica bacterium]|nr:DUF1957 domain-containing protein [Candidatus Omnitrophota bacterium]
MKPKGCLALVLHAHLPFVRHPEEEYFLEENWFYEAITETYLPLLNMMKRLLKDGVDFRLTMSLTPTLITMFNDTLLRQRYLRHLDRLVELSEKEIERTGFMKDYHGLALMYQRLFKQARRDFVHTYGSDLVAAFGKMQDRGVLEIIASSATHGYSPNLSANPSSVRAQIQIGVEVYRRNFGRDPRGYWLPEWGYYPGVDELLKEAGIKYFFMDSHGLLHADPTPRYGVYAPVFCPSGVAAFGRDWESSKQVWSSTEGYPGNPVYREYYRDIGFELEYDYVKPYIHPIGFRINTGIKYWRITGPTENKEPYNHDRSRQMADEHAEDFIRHRLEQIDRLEVSMGRAPLVTAPYDAELFGHWWFEGPEWIEAMARRIDGHYPAPRMTTPSEYLSAQRTHQAVLPSASSWGQKGYGEVWMDRSNDWVLRHVHAAGERMRELAARNAAILNKPADRTGLRVRALHQAARELLLAEASDWPFIIKTGTMVEYAERRLSTHLGRFNKLYEDICAGAVDPEWLDEVEKRDCLFRELPCASYYVPPSPAISRKRAADRKKSRKRSRP